MKRGLLWLLPLAGIAAVAWFLLGQDDGYESLDLAFDRASEPDAVEDTTAHLQGREIERAGEPTARTGLVVRGIVVDEADRPLPDVPVEARPDSVTWYGSQAKATMRRAFAGRVEPHQATETVRTASDGTFVFTRLSPDENWILEARPRAPAVGARSTFRPQNPFGRRSEIRLRVWQGSPLRVRVEDGAGRGLAAFVGARGPWPRSNRGQWFRPEQPTDASGRLEFPAVPSPAVGLSVRVPDRVLMSSIAVDTPAADEVVIRIGHEDDARVAGRVLDTEGQPIAGAEVLVAVVPNLRSTWTDTRTQAMARAAADGTFEVRGLPAAFLASVSGQAPGYCARTEERGYEPLEAGRTKQIDVVLLKGSVLTGRVLDPDGQPVPSATVSVGPAAWRPRRYFNEEAKSDARGAYRVAGLPPGNLLARVSAEGLYLSATTQALGYGPPLRGVALTIETEGAALEKDLVMKRGVPVEGRVVGPAGEAVAGASVEAAGTVPRSGWMPGRGVASIPRVTCDAEGRFAFAGLEPAPNWVFKARRADLCSAPSDPVTLAEGQSTPAVLELVVHPSATLGGQVLDEVDRPVAGHAISLRPPGAVASTQSDASGRFMFRRLPAGTYTVTASGKGERGRVEIERTLDWGVTVDDVVVRVPEAKPISGTLVDEAGEPVAGQAVTLQGVESRRRSGRSNAYTDLKGAFVFERVASGRYHVAVNRVTIETVVEPGDTGVRLVMPATTAVVIEGTVLDPDGRPVSAGSLTVWVKRSGRGRSGTGAQIAAGRFRAELPAGTGEVDLQIKKVFDLAGRPLDARPFELAGVDPRDGPVEVRLERGRTIAGRVVDAAGDGVAGVRISASGSGRSHYWDPRGHAAVVTDTEGRFRLVGLGDEEVAVQVQAPTDYAPSDGVKALPGAKDVVIRLTAAAALEGRVVGPDGAGVAGAQVSATWQPKGGAYQHRRVVTDVEGAFRLEGLGTELLNLSVGAPSGQQGRWPYVASHQREVRPGASNLVIALEAGIWVEGEVVAPGSGPIGRGSVTLRGKDPAGKRIYERVRWKADGTFEIGPVPSDEYQVQASPQSGALRPSQSVSVRAPATGVRLVLEVGAVIEGRVLGTALKYFRVNFIRAAGSPGRNSRDARIPEDGTFVFGSLELDAEGLLFAHRRGDDRYALLHGVRAGGGPYELELAKGLTIAGRVAIDVPAESLKKIRVSVKARGPHGIQVSMTLRGQRDFVLKGLPPGAYTVSVNAWGGGGQWKFAPVPEVAAGTTDLVLEPQ